MTKKKQTNGSIKTRTTDKKTRHVVQSRREIRAKKVEKWFNQEEE